MRYHQFEIKSANGSRLSKIDLKDQRGIYPKWSPDGKSLSYLKIQDSGLALYVASAPQFKPKKIKTNALNCVIGSSCYAWQADSSGILYLERAGKPSGKAATRSVPDGSSCWAEEKTTVRTYQDLLKSPADEDEFANFLSSQLIYVPLKGQQRVIVANSLIMDFSPSPTGKNILVKTLKRPFSYLVPYYLFANRITVNRFTDGKEIEQIADFPILDNIPQGFSATYQGPRQVDWVPYSEDAIFYVQALDKGNPKLKVEARDQVMVKSLGAAAKPIAKLKHRFSSVVWLGSNQALTRERWWNTRREITRYIEIAQPKKSRIVFDRSFEDSYTDPGRPLLVPHQGGSLSYIDKKGNVVFSGLGASKEGYKPFLQEVNVFTSEKKVIWQSAAPYFSRVRHNSLTPRRRTSSWCGNQPPPLPIYFAFN